MYQTNQLPRYNEMSAGRVESSWFRVRVGGFHNCIQLCNTTAALSDRSKVWEYGTHVMQSSEECCNTDSVTHLSWNDKAVNQSSNYFFFIYRRTGPLAFQDQSEESFRHPDNCPLTVTVARLEQRAVEVPSKQIQHPLLRWNRILSSGRSGRPSRLSHRSNATRNDAESFSVSLRLWSLSQQLFCCSNLFLPII